MVTVLMLCFPDFENFQLISGEKGIQNPFSGTGIFDWESQEDIARTFRKGEFVITPLSIARDDFEMPTNASDVDSLRRSRHLPSTEYSSAIYRKRPS